MKLNPNTFYFNHYPLEHVVLCYNDAGEWIETYRFFFDNISKVWSATVERRFL